MILPINTMLEDMMKFYATQSRITNPGEYVGLFSELPHDIPSLCRIIRGLVFPIDGEEFYGYEIPRERKAEVDTRYVRNVLRRIMELDDSQLTRSRPPEKRVVGSSHDMTALLVSILRSRGIPARTRIGYARYIPDFGPDFIVQHLACEYWDETGRLWRLVDPGQDELLMNHNKIAFDPTDTPHDQFLFAGKVWQMCRAGKADPEGFGEFPDSDLKGWWLIRHNLVHELAALNKMEMLMWDSWGLGNREPTEEQLMLFDEAATLTQAGDVTFDKMQALYEREDIFRVSPEITCYSFVSGPKKVQLSD